MEQNRDLTDRNRIRGRTGRTNGPMTMKSISIQGQGGKSGRGAAKAVVLTPGGLIPKSTQKTFFVILSAAKNLSFKAAEILHSAALRSE